MLSSPRLTKCNGISHWLEPCRYSLALARKGLNVVLIARSKDKLAAVAEEITGLGCVVCESDIWLSLLWRHADALFYGRVEAKVVVADLADAAAFGAIGKAIEGLEVGVLINNAGLSYSYPDYLVSFGDKESHIVRSIPQRLCFASV